MKRIFLHEMDWVYFQSEYDSGLTLRQVAEKCKVGGATLMRGAAKGLLKTRDGAQSLKLAHHLKPRDYSECRKHRSALCNYRADCSFKFDLKNFPLEFDFALIETHGWYSPSNKSNNLFGISRDHMVSVRYGFDNNISAKIISHPANCKLMLHSENVAKHTHCSITIEMLEKRIREWNEKYGGLV